MINKEQSNYQPLKHIIDEWEYLGELGEGSFGSKQVEIDILNRVESKYGFLEYYGYGIDDAYYYIYMEYIDGAKSIKYKLDNGYKFSEHEIIEIFMLGIKAIQHLHNDNNTTHRDIKSDHILLVYDVNELKGIKIIDFGVSKTLEHGKTNFNTYVGTDGYMAPEVRLRNGKAGRKSDIWSLGCVLVEMLGGDLNKIEQGIPLIPNTNIIELKQTIQQCLVIDPNERLNSNNFWSISFFLNKYKLKLSNTITQNKNPIFEGFKKLPLDQLENDNLKLSLFNHKLAVGVIPNSVTTLMDLFFNHELAVGVISNSVTTLIISSFNHKLAVGVISNSVTYLNLSSFKHKLTVGVIPNSVTNLNLRSFNHKLTVGVIPNSVTNLNLPLFNHELAVDVIPNSVTNLKLRSFNHKLAVGVIPNSVTDLNLRSFNHELAVDVIPNEVKFLNLSSYNMVLANIIPNSVTNLELQSYDHPLIDVIPGSVKELSFGVFNQYIEIGEIPESLTFLDIGDEFELSKNGKYLPTDPIIKLKCGFTFSKQIHQRDYPISVVNLSLPNYNIPLTKFSISKSISTLELGTKFKDYKTLEFIPPNVIQLKFGDDEFINSDRSKYLLKIKPFLNPSISKLIINNIDVSEEISKIK